MDNALGKEKNKPLRLLVFGGTTEGREFAEYLDRRGISAQICVATEYGETLLGKGTTLQKVHTGRLDRDAMEALMRAHSITHVVDATHPYAVEVSANIREASEAVQARYLRLLRAKSGEADADRSIIWVASVAEAVDCLKEREGNILAATGSKELHLYTQLPDYQTRVFARILSTRESMDIAAGLGFQGRNLICMQGPFSEELNVAMLRSVNAAWLVTKESGKTGGFPEKLRAAHRAGAGLVVVGRPPREDGYSFEELTALIDQICKRGGPGKGCTDTRSDADLKKDRIPEVSPAKRTAVLIGIGPGGAGQMTIEAAKAIEAADLLIGADRMLHSARAVMTKDGKEVCCDTYCAYLADEIAGYIRAHTKYKRICILLSGDIGFYSGAKKLTDRLEEIPDLKTETVCGISSVVYLCGKLRTVWEDVKLVSLHGRRQNLVSAVLRHPKVFALVGKKDSFVAMCRTLEEYGLGEVKVSVGSNLSYADEKIVTGLTPKEVIVSGFLPEDLCSVLIENPQARDCVAHGLEDEAFLRGKVPMTKSEVRSISLSKLRLERSSILYDIGAGTGSVSIEAGRMAADGLVYAIEKKTEAAELIRQNMRHLQVSNIEVIEGLAPEALEALPAPTHAFLGGTSGNMRSVIELLLQKNPRCRIVINAIALETVGEILHCLKELPVEETEIVSVTTARAKEVGRYHMMMGQNPVYVISCTGNSGS